MKDGQQFSKSIVLIGPVGAGKTIIARRLGDRLRLPVISTDILRRCPMTEQEIQKNKEECEKRINAINTLFIKSGDEEEKKLAASELKKLKVCLWENSTQSIYRLLLPNVQNYEAMGFKKEISSALREKFGDVAWHFYQKRFEIELLQQIAENLDEPCILDLGGGIPISLDLDYEVIADEFKKKDKKRFLQNFNMKKIGFDKVKKALKPFRHVYELQLPEDYKETMTKAGQNPLNEIFLSTKQYHQLSTKTVNVGGLIKGEEVDNEKLIDIVNAITNVYNFTNERKDMMR